MPGERFNSAMFGYAIQSLGNATVGDEEGYAFQYEEARGAKKPQYPPEYPATTVKETTNKTGK